MARDGVQAVVWQTALYPVIALELLATGVWQGAGVLGPEAFDAVPFLDLLADHGSPHALEERDPVDPLRSSGLGAQHDLDAARVRLAEARRAPRLGADRGRARAPQISTCGVTVS